MKIKIAACAAIVGFAALGGSPKANATGTVEDTIISCTEVTRIVWRCVTILGETSCGVITVPKSDLFPDFPVEP